MGIQIKDSDKAHLIIVLYCSAEVLKLFAAKNPFNFNKFHGPP